MATVTEPTVGQTEQVDQIGFSHLNVVDALFLIRDIVDVLDAAGVFIIDQASGHGYVPSLTPTQIEQLAPKVEALLKQHGMKIPNQVDVAIASLPLLLPMLGLK